MTRIGSKTIVERVDFWAGKVLAAQTDSEARVAGRELAKLVGQLTARVRELSQAEA